MESGQPQTLIEESPTIAGTPQTISTRTPTPRRSLLPIVIAGILLVVLGAVGYGVFRFLQMRQPTTTESTQRRPITITYWGMWENNDRLKKVFQEFEAANPGLTIQYAQQSPKDYSERLESAIARGQGPDIFRFHSSWTQTYAKKGLLSPVPASIFGPQQFEQTFYPSATKDLRTTQGILGIPLMTDGLGLYVNKRILSASGKQVPVTWDDLRYLARDLTIRNADGSIERAGVALGTATNVDHFSDILGVLILQNGGNPGKPETPPESTGQTSSQVPVLVGDALTYYTQFVRDDKVWNETLPNSTYAFAIEKVAMIIAPAWRAREIKQINPNFEFEVFPIPQLPGKPITWSNFWAEGVSATSKEQDIAWKLLKHLSEKETLRALHGPTPSQKIVTEVYPRTDMSSELITDQYVGAIVRQAPSAQSWFMQSRTFDKGVNDKFIEAYKDAVTKMSKGTRYAEVAPILVPAVTTIMSTYGLQTQ